MMYYLVIMVDMEKIKNPPVRKTRTKPTRYQRIKKVLLLAGYLLESSLETRMMLRLRNTRKASMRTEAEKGRIEARLPKKQHDNSYKNNSNDGKN